MTMVSQMPRELYKEFEQLNLGFVAHAEGITIEVEPTLEQEIQKGQLEDAKIQEIKEIIEAGKATDFTEDKYGTMWFRKRICVPDVDHLREKILQKALGLFHPSWQYQDVSGFEGEILVVWHEA
jgi:TPP-dependent trihydroxycyclohexane-1,2-dione (THcHDO) dehydratase